MSQRISVHYVEDRDNCVTTFAANSLMRRKNCRKLFFNWSTDLQGEIFPCKIYNDNPFRDSQICLVNTELSSLYIHLVRYHIEPSHVQSASYPQTSPRKIVQDLQVTCAGNNQT